jgi:hypothetical protein
MNGDTVYDKSSDLTWTRCSYGRQWTENGGCAGSVKLLDWGSAIGTSLAEGRKLATSAARRVAKHRGAELQAASDRRNAVSRDTVDRVLDKHGKRTVLCMGRVLPDRHANVEFPDRRHGVPPRRKAKQIAGRSRLNFDNRAPRTLTRPAGG